jgi:hypothetical protein
MKEQLLPLQDRQTSPEEQQLLMDENQINLDILDSEEVGHPLLDQHLLQLDELSDRRDSLPPFPPSPVPPVRGLMLRPRK